MRTDNEIWQIIFSTINSQIGVAPYSIGGVYVQQGYQQDRQGMPNGFIVALHSIDSRRYGFPEDEQYWDADLLEYRQRQTYWLERTYQVNAWRNYPDETDTGRTAFDILDAVASILQTAATLEIFAQNNIGVLRIQPLRVGYIVDDQDRYEQVPSFDFTLTYQQVILSDATAIDKIETQIYEV